MRKEYEQPSMEIVYLDQENVILTSGERPAGYDPANNESEIL